MVRRRGMTMSEKRVAVITGAAGGIGRATALELGRAGYALAVCDVDAAAIERAAAECGAEVARVVDVSRPEPLEAFAMACRERFGHVDVLVNNAGILRTGGWQDATEADWRRLFEVNLLSVALATKAFLPLLVTARGHVLNLASGAALLPFPGYPAYGPVKAGVLWLSEYQRAELAPLGVRVSCVCPLLVRTAMGAAGNVGATKQPDWMFHTPEHVARVIHRAIGRGRFLVYASSLLRLLHALYRFAPWLMRAALSATARRRVLLAVLLAASCLASSAYAQPTAQFREWNRPLEPFRIAGPLYYVGVAQVTALLLTTSEGHVLIDGAFAESATQILDNVRKLGFRPEDVRILLSTHAHLDHAGGLAHIKARTGARLYAGADDVPLLGRGGKGDFAFGDDLAFPPVAVDVPVKDGDRVELGGLVVRAIATPGHTRGCTSWAFTIEADGRPVRVMMIGGTTAPGYRLVGNAKYPAIASDFERTFARLKGEAVDLLLEGHGFAFGLEDKRAGRRPFTDPDGYRARVAESERSFREQLAKERAGGSAGTGTK
jgi:metallo-beta-lactamase class B